jgi:23S rRNA (guanosine2251-2'-O)-methyltransferase
LFLSNWFIGPDSYRDWLYRSKYNLFSLTNDCILNDVNYFCAMRKLSMEELGRKSVEEFRKSEKIPIIVVLENIRSGYNVGSVFRTADAFLLQAVYICGYTAHPPHKEIKKTALGAEETVDWKYFKKIKDCLDELRDLGYHIYAVEQAMNSHPLHQVAFDKGEKLAVIFGNEVTGVEQSTIALTDGCIEIPQLGMKHSLNIATAAGVVLWELVRTRIPPTRKGELSKPV